MITERDALFVGGKYRRPHGSEHVDVVSPMTEEAFGSVPLVTRHDVDDAVAFARRAFDEGPWPGMDLSERAAHLMRLAERLEPMAEVAARLQCDEMGSPLAFMRRVSSGLADRVQEQIDAASAVRLRDEREVRGGRVVVLREPIGVVAGVIPWNGPLLQVLAKMLPAVLTGSTVVMKPAIEAPLTAYLVADALAELDIPEGVISILAGGGDVGEALVRHPGVDKVSFTGSTVTGRSVAQMCAEQVKRVTLELGGKSAAIVLDDADLDRHLATLLAGSLSNNGQICHSTTRILVSRRRHDEVRDRLVAAIGSLRVGDPLDPATQIGPLATERQRDRVEGYLRSGIEQGATVAAGGPGRPFERGWFVSPTLFGDVDNGMTIAQEEIFGPVLCLITYGDEREAVRIANDSPYGLGGAVYTTDEERGLALASRLHTGSCHVNDGAPGGGGGPFGGVKQSGIGRERGIEGYEAYYELKSIALPAR